MLQCMRCRFGVTAPRVDDSRISKVRFKFSWMHDAELANHIENLLFQSRHASNISWVQELPDRSMNKPVGVKNIFFDIQRCIAALKITRAIPFDPMPQY